MTKLLIRLCGVAILAAGCGVGGDDDSGGGPSPGVGSGTLVVVGDVDASENAPNGTEALDFASGFVVAVTLQGNPVTGADVTMSSPAGLVTLAESGGTPGTYTGAQAGYYRSYTLSVTSGQDYIAGVKVVGPAIHTINAPAHGGLFPVDQDMTVQWSPTGASDATIETNEMDETSILDNGSYLVDRAFLQGDPGNVDDDQVRLRRIENITPDGALAGSLFTVTLSNEIEFQLDGT